MKKYNWETAIMLIPFNGSAIYAVEIENSDDWEIVKAALPAPEKSKVVITLHIERWEPFPSERQGW